MLAGDVYEDEKKVVVRIEIPGMDKKRLDLQVVGDGRLVVSGEKQFERESGDGRYRTFECAYGSFRRSVNLPVPVVAEKVKATYRDGVLRVELPKRSPAKAKRIEVRVH